MSHVVIWCASQIDCRLDDREEQCLSCLGSPSTLVGTPPNPLRRTRRVSEEHPGVDPYSRNTCSHLSNKSHPSCLRKVPALFQEAWWANQTPASNYWLRLVSAIAPQRLSIVSRLIIHQLRHGPSLEFALVLATASIVDQYNTASPVSISSLWSYGLRIIRCLLLPSIRSPFNLAALLVYTLSSVHSRAPICPLLVL